jgi:hypothetical protein
MNMINANDLKVGKARGHDNTFIIGGVGYWVWFAVKKVTPDCYQTHYGEIEASKLCGNDGYDDEKKFFRTFCNAIAYLASKGANLNRLAPFKDSPSFI